jgi:hypothetical protein
MRATRTTVDEKPWPSGWERPLRMSDKSRCYEPAQEFDASAHRHHRLLPPSGRSTYGRILGRKRTRGAAPVSERHG